MTGNKKPILEWNKFLDQNYHHICHCIRPEAFFSWLRSRNILTFTDQEEVERKYVTTVMKSGHLIDLIKSKGKPGFDAFMEVVEYVYPDTYSALTGEEARLPPPEFNPSSSANSFPVAKNRRYAGLSAEILCQMGELVTALSGDNACKKVELTKLQQYVSKLQQENEDMCQEMRHFHLKLKESTEHVNELMLEREKIMAELEKHKDDAKRKSVKIEQISSQWVRYMDESNELRKERDDLKSRDNNKLERTASCWTNGIINRMDSRKCSCERDKKDDFTFENNLKLERAKSLELQNQHNLLQQRYERLEKSLKELQIERNDKQTELEALQSENNELLGSNRRLQLDCEGLKEHYRQMDGKMISLYHEIDQLRLMSTPQTDDPLEENNTLVYRRLAQSTSVQSIFSRDKHLTLLPPKTLPSRDQICRQDAVSFKECFAGKYSLHSDVIPQTPGRCPELQRKHVIKMPKQLSKDTDATTQSYNSSDLNFQSDIPNGKN